MLKRDDYKYAIISLFKSGKPTDEQWDTMAEALCDLMYSDDPDDWEKIKCIVKDIDDKELGELRKDIMKMWY